MGRPKTPQKESAGHTASSGFKDPALTQLCESTGLTAEACKALIDLGVDTMDDLTFCEETDLVEAGIRKIKARSLLRAAKLPPKMINDLGNVQAEMARQSTAREPEPQESESRIIFNQARGLVTILSLSRRSLWRVSVGGRRHQGFSRLQCKTNRRWRRVGYRWPAQELVLCDTLLAGR